MSADIERWEPPNDATAFESLCLDLWRDIWHDPNAQKNGRSGQPQAGVDVFGQHQGNWVGVQCKLKDGLLRSKVRVKELEAEVEAAKQFKPPLANFILATTGPRDAKVQERARNLTEEHKPQGLFGVAVWSWDETWPEPYGRKDLLIRIAPDYWPRRSALLRSGDTPAPAVPALASDRATPSLAPERSTIPEKSAAEILANLKDIPSCQFFEKAKDLYFGRWTGEPGWQVVVNALPGQLLGGRWSCTFKEVGSVMVVLAFSAQDLSRLRPGASVTVSGRIIDINVYVVSLEDAIVRCDIVPFCHGSE